MSTYYMHLMDGRPAYFDDGTLVYMTAGGYPRCGQWLCADLKTIRKQQQLAFAFWIEHEMEWPKTLDYVRVSTPCEDATK